MKGAAADSDQAAVDQGTEDGAEFYAFKMSQAEKGKGQDDPGCAADAVIKSFNFADRLIIFY